MTEQIKVTGVSQRKFAKLVGCHHSYIGRLVREGKIPVNADGTIDPAQAKRARSANTVVGRNRQLNQGRRSPLSRVLDRHCDGCGGLYSSALARELGSSNVRSFCSRECAADVLAGRTREEIQARLRKEFRAAGWSVAEVNNEKIFDYGPADGSWNF